jgi:hypothetical protein
MTKSQSQFPNEGNGKGYKKGVFCEECGGRIGVRTKGNVCTTCQQAKKSHGRGYKNGVVCSECGGKVGIRCSGNICSTCDKEIKKANAMRFCAECGSQLSSRNKHELCVDCRKETKERKVLGVRRDVRCECCGGHIGCRTEGTVCSHCKTLKKTLEHYDNAGCLPYGLGVQKIQRILTVARQANHAFTVHENNTKTVEELQELALAAQRFLSPAANSGSHNVEQELIQEATNGLIVGVKLLDKNRLWEHFFEKLDHEVTRLEERTKIRASVDQ